MDEGKIQRGLKKLLLLFIFICVVIFVGSRFVSISLENMYNLSIDEQLEERAEQYRVLMLKKIDTDLQTLNAIASFMQFNEETDLKQFAEGLYKSNSQTYFSRMGYFTKDKDGIRVSSNGVIEQNISIDDLYDEVQDVINLAWNGESQISNVYYDKNLAHNMIAYAVPIYTERKITGVLYATQYAMMFAKTLDDINSLSDEGIAAIVYSDGRVIVKSEKDNNETIIDIDDIKILPYTAKQQLKQLLLSDNENESMEFSYNDMRYRVAVKSMDINNTKIVLIDTEDSINSILTKSKNVIQIAGIVILMISILFIIFSYRFMNKNTKKLVNAAYYDPLTGAFNKQKFNQLLYYMWEKKVSCSVVAINIRHFKFMNEIFGVVKSDRLLCYMKDTIETSLKDGEFLCRDTADMFFVFLKTEEQKIINARIKQMISEIGVIAERLHSGYTVFFYCGVASASDCIQDKDGDTELMTHAMFALNRAKQGKQTKISFYDSELHKKAQLENYIESQMHQALSSNEFRLYLQPKFNLHTSSLGGAEALVRWITNEGKIIFPDQFIPLFEQNGFCIKLDLYMVEQVCKQLREWLDSGLKPVPISVNQTKLLFYEEGYAKKLRSITKKYNISPSYITLEVLEGLALENIDKLNECINELKTYGFKISMDDFGSGYSSLNTLCKIRIDELKLDRRFLMAAAENENGGQRIIMEHIIAMAKKLKISTVAEGVETAENEKMITELNCDYGQGYFYSKPIPSDEFKQKYLLNKQED